MFFKRYALIDESGYIVEFNSMAFDSQEAANNLQIPEGYTELDYDPNEVSDGVVYPAPSALGDNEFFDPNYAKNFKMFDRFNVNRQRFEKIKKYE